VNTITNLRGPLEAGNLLTELLSASQRRTLLRGLSSFLHRDLNSILMYSCICRMDVSGFIYPGCGSEGRNSGGDRTPANQRPLTIGVYVKGERG